MPARDLLGDRCDDPLLRTFLVDPTWIADQFLNPNEYSLSMRSLLPLLAEAGLSISEWIGAPRDLRGLVRSDDLLHRFARLDDNEKFVALDLLLKLDRYFLMLDNRKEE